MTQDRIKQLKSIFDRHFKEVDEEAQVILKGHLLIEEVLYRIITTFVFHPAHIENANLTFYNKVSVARSLSLGESENTMWNLILAFNTLRNKTSHFLDLEHRKSALEKVRLLYEKELSGEYPDEVKLVWQREKTPVALSYTFSLCFGFLGEFEEEAVRFKEFVTEADKMMNKQ